MQNQDKCDKITHKEIYLAKGDFMEIPEENRKKWINSLDAARKINIEQFYSDCNQTNDILLANRQEYNREMVIPLYLEQGKKFIVYIMEQDAVKEISVTQNLPLFIGQRLHDIVRKENGMAVSYYPIAECMADTIKTRLHLQHGLHENVIVQIDSPVYVMKRRLKEYIEAAYGIDWKLVRALIKKHYELTEIGNFDFTIYIKQELDQIIRMEASV